ncbi:MAG TPA: rhamnulokinase family protein [Candidatus Saccharimonadales bacterium]|nr:rhamnulokinase family protein [Candidatus Saccharimonadales bacterium]
MNSQKICLAVDLGASGGRVVAGIYDGNRLELAELNRFPNDPVKGTNGWHWNLEGLFASVKDGIALAVKKYGEAVVSAGVDTWGVDYGLLDADGKLLCAPFQYRDRRTQGMEEAAFRRMPRQEIYERTGIQFLFFNTLFQLLAESPARLERAKHLLFMPDLIHYFLTGVAVNEKTIASTSQLLNPGTQEWEQEVIKAMGFPGRIFGRLVDAGTVLGKLRPHVMSEVGAKDLQVIAPAEHDTASAVVGVPAEESEPVFLSSGTWSCMGRELKRPAISDASFQATFSNEGGVFCTTRFLKNIAGMWLLQESKRIWDAAGSSAGYADLITRAKKSPPFAALIDPDAADFQAPANMLDAIDEFCRRTDQKPPADTGANTRLILESLALKYRFVKESLAQVTDKPIDRIYIVGGGSQNHLLNQFTADALNCTVVAGPVEAASIGNIIMQLFALGDVHSLAEGRSLIRRSFETNVFQPEKTGAWDEAYARFQNILPH